MVKIVEFYNQKLQASNLPKLLFHANSGAIIGEEQVAWCRDNLSNLTTVDLGDGLHFVQEDHPDLIGSELASWYASLG